MLIRPLLLAFSGFLLSIAHPPTSSLAANDPLKVYILVGQSNMQGHAHVRTLKHLGMDPASAKVLAEIQDEKGQPREFEDVRIAYLSSGGMKTGKLSVGFGANEEKIGPELTFGIQVQQSVQAPILIIKAAWGGKSINTDFRSPSAGAYEFDPATLERMKSQGKDIAQIKQARAEATGVYYRQTVDHIKSVLANLSEMHPAFSEEDGYELAGLVWFQGWNDMVDSGTYPRRGDPGGYDAYSEVLAHLIRDFRKDLNAPSLPFVIGVMGVGGPTDEYGPEQQRYLQVHQGFRDAMAAPAKLPEFAGNVQVVLTEKAWDQELSHLVDRDGKLRGLARKLSKDAMDLAMLESEEGIGRALTADEKAELEKQEGSNRIQQSLVELMRKERFTSREREILEVGPSNAAFHYLGSAKIMTQIGKAFADSLTGAGES